MECYKEFAPKSQVDAYEDIDLLVHELAEWERQNGTLHGLLYGADVQKEQVCEIVGTWALLGAMRRIDEKLKMEKRDG